MIQRQERLDKREKLLKQILSENPEILYSKADVHFDQTNCVICLEPFTDKDLI